MGFVLRLYEGKDGFRRGCELRTVMSNTGRKSTLNRPINKLYPLEIQSEKTSQNINRDNIETENEMSNQIEFRNDNLCTKNDLSKNNEVAYENGRPKRVAAEKGILKRIQLNQK